MAPALIQAMGHADLVATGISQHHFGILSRVELYARGVPKGTIDSFIRLGKLIPVFPSVFRWAGVPDTWEGRALAALIWGGDQTVLTHRSAARLQDLGLITSVVEITSPHRTKAPVGIRLHHSDIDPLDSMSLGPLRVTSVPRTLLTLGDVVPPEVVDSALDRALRKGLTDVKQLAEVYFRVARRGMNGVAALRSALGPRVADPEEIYTELERRTFRVMRASGLPLPVPQHPVVIGGRSYYIDFAYPGEMLAIETDGWEFHSTRARRQADLVRQNELVAAGWTVVRFGWDDVVTRPWKVVATIRQALAKSSLSA